MAVRGARAATWKIADNLLGAATPADATPWFAAFVKRLGELGWIDGSTIAIEYRWAESRGERYAEIAAELVKLKVDVIVTWASAPVLAAKQATQVIPVVFAAQMDPVGAGVVVSLARPGGNLTGLSLQQTDTAGKRLELLREVVRRSPSLGDHGECRRCWCRHRDARNCGNGARP
ncbi:MAG: ABC transporter substrate binding protein [Pseudolabrys sp.]